VDFRRKIGVLELFRRNHFLNSLLLLPYSVLLGMDFFFHGAQIEYPVNSPLYDYFFSWLDASSTWNGVLAIFLLFIQAVMINRIVIRHRITRQTSLLAGVIYILVMNLLPGVRGVHDVMIANLFAILMISNAYPMMRLYRTEKLIFNMGFWAAMSFVFFPGYVILIPFAFVALYVLRTINIIEISQYLIGLFNVIFLVLTLSYILPIPGGYDSLDVIPYWRNLKYLFTFSSWPFAVYLSIIYLMTIIAVLRYYTILAKQDFKAQKVIKLTFILWSFMVLSILFVQIVSPHHLLIVGIPLSIIVGIMLTHWKQKLAAELIHLLVVVGILYLQYQSII